MSWRVVLARSAEKQLSRFPKKEVSRIEKILDAFEQSPFSGDIVKLFGEGNTWRRRVGNYRIIYEPDLSTRTVFIYDITRRTSTTY